jgi:hypothetical protein
MVGTDIFLRFAPLDASQVARVSQVADYDLQLRRRSAPIDRGVVLPGVNDGYTGRAPDLGAYEYGAPVPHYGPRP